MNERTDTRCGMTYVRVMLMLVENSRRLSRAPECVDESYRIDVAVETTSPRRLTISLRVRIRGGMSESDL